jgi:lactate dehydrogenase-like 2-hydroxyacid dehydrogenase
MDDLALGHYVIATSVISFMRLIQYAVSRVLTPHLGSATIEARQDMGERVILNIMTWQNGHRAPDRVIPAML